MTRSPHPPDLPLLGAVAAGGAIGAAARHLLTLARPDAAPWVVLAVNVVGCLLMGALVVLTDRDAPRLLRPFLGTGMLGGFTTVSTYAVTTHVLVDGDLATGLAYALVTPVLALAAAGVGSVAARQWMVRR